MKVTFLAGEVGNVTSGQSRFLLNLASGVRAAGIEVAVCGSSLQAPAKAALEARGIRTESLGLRSDAISQARLLTLTSRVGRRVAARALASLPADWYVVLSDAVVDAIEVLPPDRSAYVCNGDLALLFLSPTFYASNATSKRWLARGMARYILQNADRARRFGLLLANSTFTRNLMSFLYATPFAGVVYPPVDPALFGPETGAAPEGYAVAVARNANEQGLDVLRRIAAEVPLRVVGGAKVPGATNLGRISDEELRPLYARARLTVLPMVSEMFGYAVAESLTCGTPVLSYDVGGPAEQIEDGRTGWKVADERAFVAAAIDRVRNGYDPAVRTAAARSADRFSIATVTRGFLAHLAHPPPAGS